MRYSFRSRLLACFLCFVLVFYAVPSVAAYTVDGGVTPSYDGKLLNPGDYSVSYVNYRRPVYSRYQSSLGVTFSYQTSVITTTAADSNGYSVVNSGGWATSSNPGNWLANDDGILMLLGSIGTLIESGKEYHLYIPTVNAIAPRSVFSDYNSSFDTLYMRIGFVTGNDPSNPGYEMGIDPTGGSSFIASSAFNVSVTEEVLIGNVTWNHYVFTCNSDMIYPFLFIRIADKPSNVYNFYVYVSSVLLDNIILSDSPVVAEEDSTNGWLAKIKSVLDTVVSTITQLPTLIWNVFSEGLKGLFIPTSEQLEDLNEQLETTFSGKLGVVWTAFDVVLGILQGALNADAAGTVQFPGITLDVGEADFVLAPATVSVWPAGFDAFEAVVKSAVTMVLLLAWFNGMMRIKDRFLGDGDG